MADGKAVATKIQGAVQAFDDDFLNEAAEYGDAGRTKGIEDNVVPFLSLLQDMSPEVKKRDPEYVEGAEPGYILNKATRKLYAPDTGLVVQPWATDRCINQWVPREAGGGFQGRHPIQGTVEDSMRALGAEQRPDPKDPTKFDWVLPNGHQLIDTRYVYVNELEVEFEKDADGKILGVSKVLSASPAVISFSSTGHTVAKKWSTLRNNSVLPNGQEHPIWFKMYLMSSKPAKNNKGDFFVLDFAELKDGGWVRDKLVRDKAKNMFESFAKGNLRPDEPSASEDSKENTDVPI